MRKLNIALLTGGYSSEREVALASAGLLMKSFDAAKYNVWLVDVCKDGWYFTDADGGRWAVDRNDFSLNVDGNRVAFDYAFIVIHGTPGEDGRLQGYLDMMGVPYSSSGCASTVATFEKHICKELVRGIEGLSLARGVTLREGDEFSPGELVTSLGLPLFVKPDASGSSFGVTKVKSAAELVPAVQAAFKESDTVLVEEFVAGREFGCGVMITRKERVVLPVTEIVSHNEFFDYQAKYTAGYSDEITPADIPDALATELGRLAAEIYRTCDCRGVVRVDFIVTPAGSPYMIEVNSIPGMSPGSIVPKQLAAAGITMGRMVDMVIEDTLK